MRDPIGRARAGARASAADGIGEGGAAGRIRFDAGSLEYLSVRRRRRQIRACLHGAVPVAAVVKQVAAERRCHEPCGSRLRRSRGDSDGNGLRPRGRQRHDVFDAHRLRLSAGSGLRPPSACARCAWAPAPRSPRRHPCRCRTAGRRCYASALRRRFDACRDHACLARRFQRRFGRLPPRRSTSASASA